MPQLSELYQLKNYIDTFALGHYARVLDAVDLRANSSVAFKVMRPEHLDANGDMQWEYRAFGNEADILTRLWHSAHVVKLYDCGFISDREEAPRAGDITSFQGDVRGFIDSLARFAAAGWRPYLALENLPRYHSLFYLMKPNQPNKRWRLPSEEGLSLALQFSELLALAHANKIVYLDHKLEHVYWDGANLKVIDFNSSRRLDDDRMQSPQQYMKDVHNMCVGVLYTIFTGMSPRQTSLRPQPSSRDAVEARYTDIDSLDFSMEPSLSEGIAELLNRGAGEHIESAQEFINGLQRAATEYGWQFPDYYTNSASSDARVQMRSGLQQLRAGQSNIREARDLFREALIQDGISQDLEEELRRLVVVLNEMLNHRVVP
ncbi:MAG: hypothetical protein OXG85_03530 [Chloroflexi bacterium]|nr:hypothetical protein [Chloroflexota bacterium]